MKHLLLFALCCASLSAQTLTVSTGGSSSTQLPAAYTFADTPQGSATSLNLEITNNGSNPVQVVLVYVGATAGSAVANANYTVTGLDEDHILAPQASQPFSLNFTPSTTGQLLGYLQVVYLDGQSGSAATESLSTLEGTGTAPQILLTYNNGQSNSTLQPSATARLDFGSISTSSTSSITFTLANQTSSPLPAPTVTLQTEIYGSSAFALDTSALPATLLANSSGTFTVTFAPGQTGLTTATLNVGSNSYGIEGTGIVVSDIDALAISYVDPTGVRTSPQAASPIDFGQLVPGTTGGNTLTFTVTNPQTSFNAVTVNTLSVTGAAYALAAGPTLPAAIQPGSSISFTVTLSAATSGTFTGTLTIGTRTFSLTGLGVVSPAPVISMQVSPQPLVSAQPATVTISAATAATQTVLGTLTLQFTSAVSNVTDDPAIVFMATGGRTLALTLQAGTESATYQGSSALAFQTGTTAGTITLTLNLPNTPPLVQTFTITPALIHVASAQAARQSPNLVITVNGFDNTYSAGQMSFIFFDTKGVQINSAAMPVDATADFHQYFFTNDQTGGSFGLQASFPVKGDVTQVGSVAVTLSNSAGQTSTKLAFE